MAEALLYRAQRALLVQGDDFVGFSGTDPVEDPNLVAGELSDGGAGFVQAIAAGSFPAGVHPPGNEPALVYFSKSNQPLINILQSLISINFVSSQTKEDAG